MASPTQYMRSIADTMSNLSGRSKRAIAGAMGAVAVAAATAALVLTTAAATVASVNVTDSNYPAGTTAVADTATTDTYKTYPTGNIDTSYNITDYAGRLWADKTVYTPRDGENYDGDNLGSTVVVNLSDTNRDLDGDGTAASAGSFEVDKTDSGTFLTAISVLSSSLETNVVEPVPLDIVLVLDLSGSMNRQFSDTTRIAALKAAVKSFNETIATNNTSLANLGYSTESMSRVSVVKFNGNYQGPGTWSTRDPNYNIPNNPNVNNEKMQSCIVTPLTTYTNNGVLGTSNVSTVNAKVNALAEKGSTAADYGLILAKGVFDGEATINGVKQEGARDGVQKVVIFFTDGLPKHDGTGTEDIKEFQGVVAAGAVNAAYELKQDGTLIYTVAVLDQADLSDTTKNVNIYLNAVSSNYPEATADIGANAWTNSSSTWSNPNSTAAKDNHSYRFVDGRNAPGDESWWPHNVTEEQRADGTYAFLASDSQSLTAAFLQILAEISSTGGEESTTTGRDGNTAVTITDYLGDYMEFKGIDGILYGTKASETSFYAPGTQLAYHIQAQAQRDDRSATESVYTMAVTVPSSLLNPPAGQENVNLNNITIQVTRSTDPKTGDIVTIKVPPELIPSLRYYVEQQLDANGTVLTTVTRTEADPLRIFYSVGPKATTLSNVISQLEDQALKDPEAVNQNDNQTLEYRYFVADASSYGHDNLYPLYNNRIPSSGSEDRGTTTVAMTLSTSNPFYFYVDEPLWIAVSSGGYRKATEVDLASDNPPTLYVRERTFTMPTGGSTYGTETTEAVVWTGETEVRNDGIVYIKTGTAKTAQTNYTNVAFAKGDGNLTNTATNYLVTSFDGITKDITGNFTATMYLGNNGELDIPVYGTLAVTKNFTVDEGLDLPENATASFTLTLNGATGTYPALIRDENGHPVDPTTHAVVTTAETALFYVQNGSSFTLRDGETLRVTNLPNNATYQVVEDAENGYKATVTNNDGSSGGDFARGSGGSTTPATNGQGGGSQ